MVQKSSLRLVVLLLLVLFGTSSRRASGARCLPVPAKDIIGTEVDSIDLLKVEGLLKGRMDIETADYAGTEANNIHDPRIP